MIDQECHKTKEVVRKDGKLDVLSAHTVVRNNITLAVLEDCNISKIF